MKYSKIVMLLLGFFVLDLKISASWDVNTLKTIAGHVASKLVNTAIELKDAFFDDEALLHEIMLRDAIKNIVNNDNESALLKNLAKLHVKQEFRTTAAMLQGVILKNVNLENQDEDQMPDLEVVPGLEREDVNLWSQSKIAENQRLQRMQNSNNRRVSPVRYSDKYNFMSVSPQN